MAWFLWCVLGSFFGEAVASGRVHPMGWRVAALLAWVVLMAVLFVGALVGVSWSGSGAVIGVALGFVAAVAMNLVLAFFRGVGYAGRRSGLVDWVGENRRGAVAAVALVVVVAAGVSFVGFGPSSAAVALPLAGAVGSSAVVGGPVAVALPAAGGSVGHADQLPAVGGVVSSVPACHCADGAVCVGPRGGRYCITAAGGKKYL